MVGTKHCCWGRCNNDSRYPDRLPNSLKELKKSGKKAFIPFIKPKRDLERCKRWVDACYRKDFSVSDITKDTYICAVHWPGGKGPTEEYPDPIKAKEETKKRGVKRKAPKQRELPHINLDLKRTKNTDQDSFSSSLNDFDDVNEDFNNEQQVAELICDTNKATQTEIPKEELAKLLGDRIDRIVAENTSVCPESNETVKIVSNLSYEVVVLSPELMKHYVGLTSSQFEILFTFLNGVCPLEKITYWGFRKNNNHATKKKASGRLSKFSLREKLYICLLRLKTGFTIKTIAHLLSSPDREIKDTTVRTIFTTFIQLIFKIVREMKHIVFPGREELRRFLPKIFKTIKNVRCSIDCTEFRVQTSRNFAQQGNTFSSYKHTNTFKCLIACTPNGGACFVSDLFEGDISDVQIFEDSGIMKHLEPQDIILVDRGFTVDDLVNPIQVKTKMPAFLKGRKSLTANEELETRKIAKARIHIERFNQRLKEFKLVGRRIPLSIAPLATQMVVVACALVNFQEVLCK